MIRRDYFKRVVDQFAEVARKVLALRKEDKPGPALEAVADIASLL